MHTTVEITAFAQSIISNTPNKKFRVRKKKKKIAGFCLFYQNMEQIDIDCPQQEEDLVNGNQVILKAEEDEEEIIDIEDDQESNNQPFIESSDKKVISSDHSANGTETELMEESVMQDMKIEQVLESQQTEEDHSSQEDSEEECRRMDTDSDHGLATSPTNVYDVDHVNLTHFNYLASAEENIARAHNVDKSGLFFTKDFYDHYFPSEYAELFSLSDTCHEASMALMREGLLKAQEAHEKEPVANAKQEVQVQEDNSSISVSLNEQRLAEEQKDAPTLKRKLSIDKAPQRAIRVQETTTKKPKSNEDTVVGQIMATLLGKHEPQKRQQQVPSDLEIVAMAAESDSHQVLTSRYTKEQHRKFLESAAELRRVCCCKAHWKWKKGYSYT
jgi:hypothetical protein